MSTIRHLHRDDFVWVLGSLCNIHRLPFDARLLLSQFPPPYAAESIALASDALGLELKQTSVEGTSGYAGLPPPFLAFRRTALSGALKLSSQSDAGSESPAGQAALVVRVDGEKVLLFRAGSQTPVTTSLGDFGAEHFPDVLLFHPKLKSVKDDDRPEDSRFFGFQWFLPEVLKHKRFALAHTC